MSNNSTSPPRKKKSNFFQISQTESDSKISSILLKHSFKDRSKDEVGSDSESTVSEEEEDDDEEDSDIDTDVDSEEEEEKKNTNTNTNDEEEKKKKDEKEEEEEKKKEKEKEKENFSKKDEGEVKEGNININMNMNENEILMKKVFPHSIFQKNRFKKLDDFLNVLTHKLLNQIRKENTIKTHIESDDEFQLLTNQMKSFQNLFTLAESRLEHLENRNLIEMKSLFESTHKSKKEYRKKLNEVTVNFDTFNEELKQVEDSLSETGSTIIQTGTVLKNLHDQKTRAITIKKLLDFFNEFNKFSSDDFKILIQKKKFKFTVFTNHIYEMAAVKTIKLINIHVIPELVDLKTTCSSGLKNVKIYNQILEDDLLRKFSISLQIGGTEMVKKRALVLFEFDKFLECVDLFIDSMYYDLIGLSNEIRKSKFSNQQMEEPLDYDSNASDNYDEDVNSKKFEEEEGEEEEEEEGERDWEEEDEKTSYDMRGLDDVLIRQRDNEFYNKVNEYELNLIVGRSSLKTYPDLLRTIEKICKKYVDVLEKIFGDKKKIVYVCIIKRFVQKLIRPVVNSLFSEISIKKSDKEFLENFYQIYDYGIQFANNLSNIEVLNVKKDDILPIYEEIFEEMKMDYINREINYLRLHCSSELEKTKKFVGSREEKKGKSDSKKKTKDKRKTKLFHRQSKKYEYYYEIKFEVIRMVQHKIEASLKRCDTLSYKEELSENYVKIFRCFIDFGDDYLVQGINSSIKKFEKQVDIKGVDSFDLFNDIKLVISIMEIIDDIMERAVLSKMDENIPLKIRCKKMRHKLFNSLERMISNGLQQVYERIVSYVDVLFAKYYNKSDYTILKSMSDIQSYTDHCKETKNFLKRQFGYVETTLFGNNRDQFLDRLGNTLYNHYLTFLMDKVKVSHRGAVIFQQDVKQFSHFFAKFKSTSLDAKYEILRNLSGILMVKPENVENVCEKLLLQDKIKKEIIMKFVRMRENYRHLKFTGNYFK